MKTILIVAAILLSFSFTEWQPDFATAKKEAIQKHKLILLNFSGSDWCGPCIRMKKEIFQSTVFSFFADSNLVSYNADFPRNKKNQLDKKLVAQNENLADQYNPDGKFPYTVLIDEEGNVVKFWDGLPATDSTAFTQEVKAICNARTKP